MNLPTGHLRTALEKSGLHLALAIVLMAAACSPRVQNPFQGPTGRNSGDPATRHSVRFEVSCDRCSINWMIQNQTGTEQERGVWARTVVVYVEPGGSVANLSASPSRGAGSVQWVRIRVDGELVAEERGDQNRPEGAAPINQGLSISVPVGGAAPDQPRNPAPQSPRRAIAG